MYTRHWNNVGLTLVQRLRRWYNVKSTMIQCLVSDNMSFPIWVIVCHVSQEVNTTRRSSVVLMLGDRGRRWPGIGWKSPVCPGESCQLRRLGFHYPQSRSQTDPPPLRYGLTHNACPWSQQWIYPDRFLGLRIQSSEIISTKLNIRYYRFREWSILKL